MLLPLVLSGGSGTRLWPLSRPLNPKQLLPLVGDATMLQQTVARLDGLPDLAAPIVVCNADHRDHVHAQLHDMGTPASAIILEPVGRNTAPAVALAALHALATAGDDEPLLLVLPADHVVGNPEAFRAAINTGFNAATDGKLVTFGVVPDRPETGYGYIRAASKESVSPVERFVEKPDRATAEGYLASGDYYWNSGMFLFSARRFIDELRAHCAPMVQACEQALAAAVVDGSVVGVDRATFEACPSDSIDYAVMEKTRDGVVVPMDAGWNDVGSWAALHDVRDVDDNGNTQEGDVVAIDCEGCLLQAGHRLVAAAGLRDIVVVETDDAVLVVPRAQSQEVKTVVERLKADARVEAVGHRTRATPFGSNRHIDDVAGTTVSQIVVRAGQRTPATTAQAARQFVVAAGHGELTIGDDVTETLHPGTCVLVPAKARYRIASADDLPLTLVAVDLPTA